MEGLEFCGRVCYTFFCAICIFSALSVLNLSNVLCNYLVANGCRHLLILLTFQK